MNLNRKNIICNLTLVFFLLIASAPLAQVAAQCVLHLDKSFYVTGEVVWYKLYLTPEFKEQNVTIKTTIANSNGQVLHQYFLKNEGEIYVSGYYKIPFDLTSGMYQLAFTSLTKGQQLPVTLTSTFIPIYNDLTGISQLTGSANSGNGIGKPPKSTPASLLSELDISISLPKKEYAEREEVEATILLKDKNGNPVNGAVSVSVVDWELVGAVGSTQNILAKGEDLAPTAAQNLHNTLYLSGTVRDERGAAFKANILGAYSERNGEIYYFKSGEDGEFLLELPEFQGSKTVQFLGYQNGEEYILASVDNQINVAPSPPLPVNDGLADYLMYSRQRKKIFQHYGILESNLVSTTVPENKKPLKADQEFVISEYEYFEKMHIFFREILSPLRFQEQSDSTFTARMYDPGGKAFQNYFEGKPLFIVDGQATRNANFVANMRMETIEKIELFFKPKKLNDNFKIFGLNGVVHITTKTPIAKLPVFEAQNRTTIQGYQEAVDFPVFHPEQLAGNRHQPFFRPQLYWNSAITTDKNGKAVITFHQSDAVSTFKIQVVAQSEEGLMGYGEIMYEVE